MTVNSPITSLCSNSTDQVGKLSTETKPTSIDLTGTPFWFSGINNIFIVLGCGSARLMNQSKAVMAGCASICPTRCHWNYNDTEDCFGVSCCQTTISSSDGSDFKKYSMNFTTEDGNNETGCTTHAFMVDGYWFSRHFSSRAVIQKGYAPLVLFWGIEKHDRYADNNCVGDSYCSCVFGYEGNPYLANGCRGTLLSS